MICTALSVIRGTAISSFDVEVLDVIADDPAAGGARLLVRVSGPAVDATGVGPGFSGSPILCDGRYAGRDLGGHRRVRQQGRAGHADRGDPAVRGRPRGASARSGAGAAARRATARPRRSRCPACRSRTRRLLLARGRASADRTVLAAPPGPARRLPAAGRSCPGRRWRPRSRPATSRSAPSARSPTATGPGLRLRALARRPRAPLAVPAGRLRLRRDQQPDRRAGPRRVTYKLTSSGGHVLGAITNDTFSAIAGRVGAGPASIPLRVDGAAARLGASA